MLVALTNFTAHTPGRRGRLCVTIPTRAASLVIVSGNGNVPSSTPSHRIPKLPLIAAGVVLILAVIGVRTVLGLTHGNNVAPPPAKTQPPPSPTSYAIPACYNPSVPPTERPKKLNVVGCASVAVALQDMSWSSWGPDGADGTGTAVFKICDPNCAAGYQLSDPVVVHAWNAQLPRTDAICQVGLKIFADMILAFPKGVPPPAVQKTNTHYDGMPAAHYVNYAVNNTPDEQFIGYTFCN